jgi:hypothetical protein
VGRYTSTVWIPGNTLSEGNVLVQASVLSYIPSIVLHTREPNVVTFQVIDSLEGDSARGDYIGPVPGAIRPLLNWTTDFSEQGTGLHLLRQVEPARGNIKTHPGSRRSFVKEKEVLTK